MKQGEIYVIGDLHIGLGEGDDVPVATWLERLAARRPRALYMNGDVFHYLIGDAKFYTSSVQKVFAKLREVRDSGIEIYYIEGNRDFFLQGSIAESAVTEIALERTIEAGGRRYLIIHGDMINDRDYPYRFWRRFSKNPVMRFGVKLTPKGVARRFVDGAERKLAQSNFKHKYRLPTELMEAYGKKKAAAGYDVVVFGHFHEKVEIPAGSATVAILPAWFEGGEAMVIDPETGAYRWEVV